MYECALLYVSRKIIVPRLCKVKDKELGHHTLTMDGRGLSRVRPAPPAYVSTFPMRCRDGSRSHTRLYSADPLSSLVGPLVSVSPGCQCDGAAIQPPSQPQKNARARGFHDAGPSCGPVPHARARGTRNTLCYNITPPTGRASTLGSNHPPCGVKL